MKHSEYLLELPAMAIDNGHGGLHIPIESLENDLDNFLWGTQNYHWNLYKDGYASLSVAASIELVLNYIDDSGTKLVRTFVGTCNFQLSSILPIQDWNATAKSMCIKNAASEAGKRLGRGLNSEVIPDHTLVTEKTIPKMKPDSKILNQLLKAIEEKDEKTITMLSNIYDIKTDTSNEKENNQ